MNKPLIKGYLVPKSHADDMFNAQMKQWNDCHKEWEEFIKAALPSVEELTQKMYVTEQWYPMEWEKEPKESKDFWAKKAEAIHDLLQERFLGGGE